MQLLKEMQKSKKVIGCIVVVKEEDMTEPTIIINCPANSDACYRMFNALAGYFLKDINNGANPVSRDWASGIIAISEAIKASFPDIAQTIREANIQRIKNETNG